MGQHDALRLRGWIILGLAALLSFVPDDRPPLLGGHRDDRGFRTATGDRIGDDDMARILIADEHALYRTGLRVVIEAALPDTEFLETADFQSLLAMLAHAEPIDLALVSLGLTGSSEPGVIRDLQRASPTTRYVIIAGDCTFDQVLRYIAEGFFGFISKMQRDDEIVASVTEVLAGRLSVPRSLTTASAPSEGQRQREVAQPRRRPWQQNPFGLTQRQKDVLALLADGLSNREIAQALHIAEPTTKIHVSALMRALNVRNRTEAAILARNLFRSIENENSRGHLDENRKK